MSGIDSVAGVERGGTAVRQEGEGGMACREICSGLLAIVLLVSRCAAGLTAGPIVRERGDAAGSAPHSAVSLTLGDRCDEIKALILADRGEDAVSRFDQVLRDAAPRDIAEATDAVLSLTAEVASTGHPGEARELESHLVAFLAQHPEEGRVPYRALQAAFFRGQNEFLMDYGRTGNALDWRSHGLVAEAVADEFIGLNHTNPSTQTQERLQTMARVCTDHYEAAILDAPDQYTRTRLACGWLAMKGSYGALFGADSALIRKQLPTHPAFECKASAESIGTQTQKIRAAARAAIDSGRQGRLFAEATRTAIAQSLAKEFEVYARIGIPENVIDDITRDLAFFFDHGMAMRRIQGKRMTRLDELAPMFKWYLWRAIISPTPDATEQEQIQAQVNRIVDHCMNALGGADMPDALLRSADSYMKRFQRQNDDLQANRFVPYFKRVLSRNRFRKVMEQLARACEEINANFEGLAGEQLDQNFGIEQRIVEARIKDYGFASFVNTLSWYSSWDRPIRTHLPDRIFGADAAEVNEYHIFAFLPTWGQVFPSD